MQRLQVAQWRGELAGLARGAQFAQGIAANAPLTVSAIKHITTEALKPESQRDLDSCTAKVAACFASEDYKEGRKAFMEKRKPQFKGQ